MNKIPGKLSHEQKDTVGFLLVLFFSVIINWEQQSELVIVRTRLSSVVITEDHPFEISLLSLPQSRSFAMFSSCILFSWRDSSSFGFKPASIKTKHSKTLLFADVYTRVKD